MINIDGPTFLSTAESKSSCTDLSFTCTSWLGVFLLRLLFTPRSCSPSCSLLWEADLYGLCHRSPLPVPFQLGLANGEQVRNQRRGYVFHWLPPLQGMRSLAASLIIGRSSSSYRTCFFWIPVITSSPVPLWPGSGSSSEGLYCVLWFPCTLTTFYK